MMRDPEASRLIAQVEAKHGPCRVVEVARRQLKERGYCATTLLEMYNRDVAKPESKVLNGI